MTITIHLTAVWFWVAVFVASVLGIIFAGIPLVERYPEDWSVPNWQLLIVVLSFIAGCSFTFLTKG